MRIALNSFATIKPVLIACLILALHLTPALAVDGPHLVIPAGGTYRGHFVEEHFAKSDNAEKMQPIRSEGSFLVAPGQGMIWKIETPVPMTIVATASGMTQGFGEVALMHVSAAKMPFLPQAEAQLLAALTGDWQALSSDYIVTRKSDAKGWHVTFTPTDGSEKAPFQSLSASGNQFVETARLVRPSGGIDRFTFTDQSVSAAAPTAAESAAFKNAEK